MPAVAYLLLLVVLFGSAPGAATEPPPVDAAPPWRIFAPDQGHFEVELPGEPTESSANGFTPVGLIRGTAWWVDQGPRAFGVELRDLPSLALTLLSPGHILDQVKTGMLEKDGGREIADRLLDFHGIEGREITYRSRDGSMLERALLLLVGSRLYIVSAAAPEAGDGAVERFLGSFRVLE